MKENLSAFIDDELDERTSQQVLDRLHADGDHFEPERYHVLIAIECTHCGYLRHHNLARLGLAPEGANWDWTSVWSDQPSQSAGEANAVPESAI